MKRKVQFLTQKNIDKKLLQTVLSNDLKNTKNSVEKLEKDYESSKSKEAIQVTEDDISEVVSMWTGIPLKRLDNEDKERLKNIENVLSLDVIGQNDAIEAISKSVRRARTGLKDPKRPIGAFLFLGPTGVGLSLIHI